MSSDEGVLTRTIILKVSPEEDINFSKWKTATNLVLKWLIHKAVWTKRNGEYTISLNKVQQVWYKELREKFGFTSYQAIACLRQAIAIAKSWMNNPNKGREPRLRKDVLWLKIDDIKEVNKEYVETSSYGKLIVEGYSKTFDEVKEWKRGEARLMKQGDEYYLHVTFKKEVELPTPSSNAIAVDINVKETVYGDGKHERRDETPVEYLINKREYVSALQKKYPSWRSLKRVLLRIVAVYQNIHDDLVDWARKEAIRVINYAKRLGKDTIILEDLNGLNERQPDLKKSWRERFQYMAYRTLQFWISWEGFKHGIAVVTVPPHYTSTHCPYDGEEMVEVGHRLFKCKKCGFQADRDSIAVLNLLRRGISGDPNSHHSEGSVRPQSGGTDEPHLKRTIAL
ncbi:transposase [Candidatus Acidianus copahuensis]|uniref:Transposase n=1 Tax=Candidatus Acidianus copahuensis TaxID=1160895 RepID=A0A031LU29_9CREN|nr:zinc ribbon domain-containing protein [Candidatus Acidianus copahuensis]EZQ11331.1 transposase [Candidatus Acidianus copahuensis]